FVKFYYFNVLIYYINYLCVLSELNQPIYSIPFIVSVRYSGRYLILKQNIVLFMNFVIISWCPEGENTNGKVTAKLKKVQARLI
ncbi:MAG: hypothetical protein LBT37_05310, partial [Lactobacillaceae bacterium]|nr:hypothetical protein [Lactobacillaceae bacterium]